MTKQPTWEEAGKVYETVKEVLLDVVREQFECVSEEELAEEERLSKEDVMGIENIESERIDKVLAEIDQEVIEKKRHLEEQIGEINYYPSQWPSQRRPDR